MKSAALGYGKSVPIRIGGMIRRNAGTAIGNSTFGRISVPYFLQDGGIFGHVIGLALVHGNRIH